MNKFPKVGDMVKVKNVPPSYAEINGRTLEVCTVYPPVKDCSVAFPVSVRAANASGEIEDWPLALNEFEIISES